MRGILPSWTTCPSWSLTEGSSDASSPTFSSPAPICRERVNQSATIWVVFVSRLVGYPVQITSYPSEATCTQLDAAKT
ncbi:hypothetical protein CONLIGDRAFT_151035 [Coniochaeta ligniaria NRRL 30616]|uniref:Uncharacterized protein n=1 Tax=Coniochaeta ligniaria NRRL 30616 TaxID=1408157 RepID=A0A1J7I5C2_9PEZI|nr:hypothetical protein CONLIGDRAFT_151035 [Coniochaeta ligniaria NRRL 30616]